VAVVVDGPVTELLVRQQQTLGVLQFITQQQLQTVV
jgi:hypothetical protein